MTVRPASGPTTTTTQPPAPTTTTTTTPAPSRLDDLGCFGTLTLFIALVIAAGAAVSFFTWACRGYIDVWLFATAASLALAVLVLLPTWMLVFRSGRVRVVLSTWFAWLSLGTPLLATLFAILGEFRCAAGALIASGLFGTIVAALTVVRRVAERRS